MGLAQLTLSVTILGMKALIIANWKMNPATYKEAKSLAETTKAVSAKAKDVTVVIAPPSLYLRELSKSKTTKISWAVQHARTNDTGANTGDISIAQSKDSGATYVIMGHAERRDMGETDQSVKTKLVRALELNMTPIVCIGEPTRAADEVGAHFEYVRGQIRTIFSGISVPALKKILIVYEPRWTIGGTVSMTPHDMHEMSVFIRKVLVESHGESGLQVQVLYGGSINETNAVSMLQNGDVKGLLIGHASVDAQQFSTLIRSIQTA